MLEIELGEEDAWMEFWSFSSNTPIQDGKTVRAINQQLYAQMMGWA